VASIFLPKFSLNYNTLALLVSMLQMLYQARFPAGIDDFGQGINVGYST
jgi:hypothetical protein